MFAGPTTICRRRGQAVRRSLGGYETELQEVFPGSVMESKRREGRIFGVDEMEIEERDVLGIVE